MTSQTQDQKQGKCFSYKRTLQKHGGKHTGEGKKRNPFKQGASKILTPSLTEVYRKHGRMKNAEYDAYLTRVPSQNKRLSSAGSKCKWHAVLRVFPWFRLLVPVVGRPNITHFICSN